MNVLVYGDTFESVAELVGAANEISRGGCVSAVVINDESCARSVAELGVSVDLVNQEDLVSCDFGAIAHIIAQCAVNNDCEIVLLPSSRKGRAAAGALAQRLGAGCLTNVNALHIDDGKLVCSRNALGGAVVAEQCIVTEKQVIAISPKSFTPQASSSGGEVKTVDLRGAATGVTHVATKTVDAASVDITEADILIVIGCGVENQDVLQAADRFAAKLGALIGCTKPVAVDRKWFSEDRVVGISGKTCKPSLAILLGVSGEVQFYAGIRDAKVIASINTDGDAQITGLADYVLVSDAAQALAELEAAL